jgi:hypothetical protein
MQCLVKERLLLHLMPLNCLPRLSRRVMSMQPYLNATKISLQLYCNTTATPWCQPAAIQQQRRAGAVKHAAAVAAVVGA